jgi:hypothetical protein
MTNPSAALEAVLEAENTALAAHDTAAAIALLPRKQQAAAALDAATPPSPRLHALALENQRLLARTIAAQQEVIALIARAARATAPTAPRYGAAGRLVAPAAGAVAIRAEA